MADPLSGKERELFLVTSRKRGKEGRLSQGGEGCGNRLGEVLFKKEWHPYFLGGREKRDQGREIWGKEENALICALNGSERRGAQERFRRREERRALRVGPMKRGRGGIILRTPGREPISEEGGSLVVFTSPLRGGKRRGPLSYVGGEKERESNSEEGGEFLLKEE